jgi:hypothetical protein
MAAASAGVPPDPSSRLASLLVMAVAIALVVVIYWRLFLQLVAVIVVTLKVLALLVLGSATVYHEQSHRHSAAIADSTVAVISSLEKQPL